jgi:N-acetylglucosamine-6-phosphate deacetylase
MGLFHHRDPGLAGAAHDDERLTPTVIADLVHLHPAALRRALARKRNVALVSDAVATGTLVEADGAAWTNDGTLAGATTGLDGAITNLVTMGVPIARALEMATAIPAQVLGLNDRGRLVPGAVADIVALDPHTARVQQVWVGGDSVPASDPA